MSDEILDFNFAGLEPALPGTFVTLPKGEYQLQCNGVRKFLTGEFAGKPDPNKSNLEFTFTVINHPNTNYLGTEHKLFHSLGNNEWSRKFLLNTLMCLMPEQDWQRGIQVPLSALIQKVQGRPVNGLIIWETWEKDGKKGLNNKLTGLKKYDPTVPPPEATPDNPPAIDRNTVSSPVAQQANAGVSPDEVANFLGDWPGGPAPANAAASNSESVLEFGF